jgi:hypothetical protein
MAHISRISAVLAITVGLFTTECLAVSNGVSGVTLKSGGAGCAGCHGATADVTVTVTITGPTALNASQAGIYTITANRPTGTTNGVTKMGFDVAASDAPTPLSVIAGQSSLLNGGNGEITHNLATGALHTTTGGTASYTFTYTMPAAAAPGSTHTLYATSALSFTGWNHATNFTVTTRPPAPSTLTAFNVLSGSVDLAWTLGGPEYKVVYKTGAVAPANDTDGTQITLGAVSSTTVNGLAAATQYTFAVYSKNTGQTVFSSTAPSATATTTSVGAATRYVDPAGVNTGNCSIQASPCKTITYAMAQAVAGNPGDIINVASGTYNLALGEVFPIVFKSGIRLQGTTNNAGNHVVDAFGDTVKQGIITSNGNASSQAKIEAIFFRNGVNQAPTNGVALGGAIYISGSTQLFTINRCFFDSNSALGYSSDGSGGQTGNLAWGGAVAIFGSVANVTNNVFTQNRAIGGAGFSHFGSPLTGNENGGEADGGALYFAGSGSVVNNTFWSNLANGGNGGGSSTGTGQAGQGRNGALSAGGNPAPTIANNIFANNVAKIGTGTLQTAATAGAMSSANAPSIANNLFFQNGVGNPTVGASIGDDLGTGSVLTDPKFFGVPDVQIRPSSPASHAGTAAGAPSVDFLTNARTPPPSIGAFEPRLIGTLTTVGTSGTPATAGQAVTFTALVSGGVNTPTGNVVFLDGATTLCAATPLASGIAQCTTSALAAGSHSITAAFQGDVDFGASTSTVLTQAILPLNPARLGNISTRGQVLLGNDVMIAGFIIGGSVAKTVVVNVAGPNLVQFGIANALPNPKLTLVRSSDQAILKSNDDWQAQANPADVAALTTAGFQPNNTAEPAIIATLQPGAYTAIVEGVGLTGVGLVGVFEVDHADAPLINISTRGQVLTGNDVMIAGFIIHGTGTQKVVVNVAGPSLNQFGLPGLANPTLTLVRSSDNAVLAVNDDWQTQTNPGDVALITAAGFQPNNPAEPAIIATLPAGSYTAIVSGVGNTTGVALVGVFAAP